MKKNKKSIYILLPVVLLIWGGVLYQLFSFVKPVEEHNNIANEFIVSPLKIKERQTFAINVNYRDPFLGKIYRPNNGISPKKNTKKILKKEEVIPLPNIIYKGIISDSKQKNSIYMLIIDGNNFYMKKGEIKNELLLKSGDKESIIVVYKGKHNITLSKG